MQEGEGKGVLDQKRGHNQCIHCFLEFSFFGLGRSAVSYRPLQIPTKSMLPDDARDHVIYSSFKGFSLASI